MGGETQNIAEQPRDTRHTARELELLERTKQHDTGKSAAPLEPRLLGWARAGPWLAGGRSRAAVLRCDWSSRWPHSLVSQARGRWAGGAAWPVPSPCSRDQLQGDTPGLHKHLEVEMWG